MIRYELFKSHVFRKEHTIETSVKKESISGGKTTSTAPKNASRDFAGQLESFA